MERFTPKELCEIFLAVDDDGEFDCPIFTSFEDESLGVAKCLSLSKEDKKAMQQALRLAKQELNKEAQEIGHIYSFNGTNTYYTEEVENKIDELTSKICRLMRNYT